MTDDCHERQATDPSLTGAYVRASRQHAERTKPSMLWAGEEEFVLGAGHAHDHNKNR